MTIPKLITGPAALSHARRKARYGHKEWIVWTDANGAENAAPRSSESLKAALLASGTQGRFYHVVASTRVEFLVGWNVGLLMLQDSKEKVPQ